MTRIVVYTHRPKRSPRKRKAEAANSAPAEPSTAAPAKPVPTIVVATGPMRLKWPRLARRIAEPRKPSPEVEAFFTRNVRPATA